MSADGIWAVVPIKEFGGAKQRLASLLTPAQRRELAAVMAEEVLAALTAVGALAGIAVVTVDEHATRLAQRIGARVLTEGARAGHTGAVTAAVRVLANEGRAGMITMPGDIPRITADEVAAVLAAHQAAPSFTIVPAHDDRGSNAVVCSPPNSVPLQFGDDSFLPHLAAARGQGIEPTIVRLPGFGMDIDHPADVEKFVQMPPMQTRTLALLAEFGFVAPRDSRGNDV